MGEGLDVVSIPQRFIAPHNEDFQSDFSLDEPSVSLGPIKESAVSPFFPSAGPRGGLEKERKPSLPAFLLPPPPVHLPPKVAPVATSDEIRRDRPFVEEDDSALVPIEKETDEKCPGGSIKECVFACVPLPELHVYGLCVRECADRCADVQTS